MPKAQNFTEINKFRTISLRKLKGKIFMSLLLRRLTSLLFKKEYIDTSVQKGRISGVASCASITDWLKDCTGSKQRIALNLK